MIPDASTLTKRAAAGKRRFLRAALRLVRDVARYAGPCEAARQLAFALAPESAGIRSAVLALLAAQAARGQPELPTVAAVERALARLDQMPAELAHEARRPPSPPSYRAPLPVEAARAVPLDRVAEQLGLEVRRRGRDVRARCPFHDDRHPSLQLDVRKGLWYCWPCGFGGDGLALVMRVRRLSFAAAVRELVA